MTVSDPVAWKIPPPEPVALLAVLLRNSVEATVRVPELDMLIPPPKPPPPMLLPSVRLPWNVLPVTVRASATSSRPPPAAAVLKAIWLFTIESVPLPGEVETAAETDRREALRRSCRRVVLLLIMMLGPPSWIPPPLPAARLLRKKLLTTVRAPVFAASPKPPPLEPE